MCTSTEQGHRADRSTRCRVQLFTTRGPRDNYVLIDAQPGMVKWEDLRIGQTLVATSERW